MFKYNERRWGMSRYVDETRGVEFRQMGSAGGMTTESAGALYWDDRIIPVRYDSFSKVDDQTGARYEEYVIFSIGPAGTPNQKDAGIVSYTFASEAEKREAEILVAEAILVSCYKYALDPLNVWSRRFFLHNRQWVLPDFGYTSSADIKDKAL